jgi:uncharacterized protein (TIGR02271 family)
LTLRTLMQAGPAKATELFARLADTSDNAVKTRERLFAELKAGLEQHVDLEEAHLFPILRKQPETKELVTAAIRDNKELRAKLGELDALPKSDETFLGKLAELQKAFRQHARDEKRELLPAVEKALSEDQVQNIVGKMETTLAEADQIQQDQAEEKRAAARQQREERERAELLAQQQDEAEQERQDAERRAQRAARSAARAAARAAEEAAEAAAEEAQEVAAAAAKEVQSTTERVLEAAGQTAGRSVALASSPARTGMLFWDMMLAGMSPQPSRAVATRDTTVPAQGTGHVVPQNEEVIPLAEEVLVIGKRTVNTGTTRIRRYVVETPVEQQVSLIRERVVVERRRPVTNEVTGESLTELTIEVVETDEVPVVAKSVQLREEVVVRTERTEHIETVRDTVRQDEVEIGRANTRRPAGARA